jgi:hypothetical protein
MVLVLLENIDSKMYTQFVFASSAFSAFVNECLKQDAKGYENNQSSIQSGNARSFGRRMKLRGSIRLISLLEIQITPIQNQGFEGRDLFQHL